MGTDTDYTITDLGKLMPQAEQVDNIGTGEVGFVVAAIKTCRTSASAIP